MSMNAVIAGVVILVVAGDMAGLYWFARRFGAFAPVRPETMRKPRSCSTFAITRALSMTCF